MKHVVNGKYQYLINFLGHIPKTYLVRAMVILVLGLLVLPIGDAFAAIPSCEDYGNDPEDCGGSGYGVLGDILLYVVGAAFIYGVIFTKSGRSSILPLLLYTSLALVISSLTVKHFGKIPGIVLMVGFYLGIDKLSAFMERRERKTSTNKDNSESLVNQSRTPPDIDPVISSSSHSSSDTQHFDHKKAFDSIVNDPEKKREHERALFQARLMSENNSGRPSASGLNSQIEKKGVVAEVQEQSKYKHLLQSQKEQALCASDETQSKFSSKEKEYAQKQHQRKSQIIDSSSSEKLDVDVKESKPKKRRKKPYEKSVIPDVGYQLLIEQMERNRTHKKQNPLNDLPAQEVDD